MKILNSFVLAEDFLMSFDELLKREMPAKQCLEVVKSEEVLIAHYQHLQKTQQAIISKYAKKKDNGDLIIGNDKKFVFKSPADEDKCTKEITEIQKESVEIPLTNKIKIYEDDLITPRKCIVLGDVIEIVGREKPKVEEAVKN